MAAESEKRRFLVITADDYGYWPAYNEGILAAIEMGAVDAVSVMTEREHCDARPLKETGIEIGLHVEFEGRHGARSGAAARSSLRVQVDRFTDLFQHWPAFLNGHHHCHARPELATPVLQVAQQIGIPVRSINRDHRQWLSERRLDTNDLLIGRMTTTEPVEPTQLRDLPSGVTEWMVHPGYPDERSGSSYDIARREDLDIVTRVQVRARYDEPVWGDVLRANHAVAFAQRAAEPATEA